MRIIQLPTNLAGQSIITTKALQTLGHKANSLTESTSIYNYESDIVFQEKNFILRQIKKIILFIKLLNNYDVFHYHTDNFLFGRLDIFLLKLFRKKIFIEFWGSEIRLYDLEKTRNPYFEGDNLSNQNDKIRRMKFWSSVTDQVFVADHSLDIFLENYFSRINIVGQRIEIDRYEPAYPTMEKKIPLIVHAPSSKAVKGSEYVKSAIDELKKRKFQFEYTEITGLEHKEALKVYKKADIVIDQLLIGSYGILACECMALGKPVVCYIQDSLIDQYPEDLPIVNANISNLADILQDLIESPDKRNEIGQRSRKFAESYHDSKVVAEKLLKVYLK